PFRHPSGTPMITEAVGDATAVGQGGISILPDQVAGRSAFERDQRNQLGTDLRLIILLASVGISVILALLIRSVTSPIYLLATIGLSTLSAIGVCQLLYGHLEYTTDRKSTRLNSSHLVIS